MQEEVEQKTVNLAVTTTKLTGRVAVKAIAWYLRHRKEKKLEKANRIPHGKQSVKELIGQNACVSTIDVSKTGLREFERIAKKYNVDFAVTKDKTVDPPKYVIFFKAHDADALNQVVKEYSAKQLDKAKKDISQKVIMAMNTRAESGQFMAPFPAYGYLKEQMLYISLLLMRKL